jgi:hypothetical protein
MDPELEISLHKLMIRQTEALEKIARELYLLGMNK